MSIPIQGTRIQILSGFFLSFEFRSGIYHHLAFVCSAFRAYAMRQYRGLTFRAFCRVYHRDIILFARAITAMMGMSLLGICHIGTKLLTFSL